MSKPILVVKYNPTLEHLIVDQIAENTIARLDDYHVFFIPNSIEDTEFKVFNGEYTDEELKVIEDLIADIRREK